MSEGIRSSVVGPALYPILARGQATLTAGTATVLTAQISSAAQVILTHANAGGTVGVPSVGTVVAGTSFVINSSNAADTSIINWFIVGL